jgi:hypothetical protein
MNGIISNQNDIISFDSNISGEFKIGNNIINISCRPTYKSQLLNCGSNDCKKQTIYLIDDHNHYTTINGTEITEKCTAVFRKTNKIGVYKLINFKLGNEVLLNTDDQSDLSPDFKFPVIQISNNVVTKNTALKVESPYYGKDTTEARLQYEWTDPVTNIKNSRTITVKNPQVYEDESMYTFGKNAFKDISVNTTITVTYKTYYTNGIQEYTTDKRTILIQPIKGLK